MSQNLEVRRPALGPNFVFLIKIRGVLTPTNTHTDCTPNTHTDGTKHTHGLYINTHILLPIVVFAIKTGTKPHTYL